VAAAVAAMELRVAINHAGPTILLLAAGAAAAAAEYARAAATVQRAATIAAGVLDTDSL